MAERIAAAFAAGLVSIAFPCVLPLVPGYLSAITAVEVERLGERGIARRVVAASVPFALGFTVVFVALGAGAAALSHWVDQETWTKIAGFVLVVLGLAFMGLLPWPERMLAPGAIGTNISDAIFSGVAQYLELISGAILILLVLQNQDGIARGQPVHQRGLHAAGAGRADQKHVVPRAK